MKFQSHTAELIQLTKNISIFLLPQVTPKTNLEGKYPFIFSWFALAIQLFVPYWLNTFLKKGLLKHLLNSFANSRNIGRV